ncbi:MAG: DUF6502 family protein [Candidatus Thiodiazotropha lotti]|uniref:Uncharacterized protein n=1 Tax=Candidatus Thiodiazotropha endoloripes TaxID=1818881 RepID=A0A1E2ULK2_9GAMM|nr:DUF6502 family protein [Candidatus Thiodiazotropha endoloripes]MCG7898654.1 DUF6502 family protein [Candidatus Thiodiazotropha weberae]MCG7998428.1 DUF6502 family protein [Candidatus Thiodiazotropha lotti]MCG7901962.1 DUF6502 family protein [Candidatus Thiodiazotropha weberae]MCG7914883.1 DUF6502 family protein [Candidatus Thiodiazotropha weberae]MCW4190194.1 DUF6502 family protein [Candidatus Thiodiazotropha weberae]
MDENRKILTASILKLLRPLVRLMLRNGFTYGDFADLSKWTFMDVASKEFGIPGRKQTVSRVSVITGLTRKEVSRLQKIDTPDDSAIAHQYNRAARVISGWLRDKRFTNKKGEPAALEFDRGKNSFSDLVREHSGDVPPRAIYDELLRVGTIAKNESGKITLLSDGYIPRTGETGKLHILGTDVELLIDTIDHNLQTGSQSPYFQRKVAYDNLPVEALPEFRNLSAEKSQALLLECDKYLSRHDRDVTSESDGTGRIQAGIGIYYFEKDIQRND